MSQNLTISETGLKLIKAFEGYRPVDRELISGQRIVGYGHRLYSEDAVMMDKATAESTLRADLEPFEDMINSEVHAPMTQSQFDALCSFAFNIGPKAFLQSDTLRALNNGRPLDAANGLDIWRKSEIDGKIYVVDALMRRRTAEKALFLRTKQNLPAGREDLPPVPDDELIGLSTGDDLPVFTAEDSNGVVATAPYDAFVPPSRRRDDGPAGALMLSERDVIETEEGLTGDTEPDERDDSLTTGAEPIDLGLDLDLDLDLGLELSETDAVSSDLSEFDPVDENSGLDPRSDGLEDVIADEQKPARQSPIAAAATDIVARLDALIEDADARFEDPERQWSDGQVSEEDQEAGLDQTQDQSDEFGPKQNVIDLKSRSLRDQDAPAEPVEKSYFGETREGVETEFSSPPKEEKPTVVIDELAKDDAIRVRTDSAAKYIQTTAPLASDVADKPSSPLGLWIPILLGFTLIGLAGGAMMSGSKALLGDWGPIITFTGFVIGVGLILMGVYAWLRINIRD